MTDQFITGSESAAELWEGFIAAVAPHLAHDSQQYRDLAHTFYFGGFAVMAWGMALSSRLGQCEEAYAAMKVMGDELTDYLQGRGLMTVEAGPVQ